MKRLIFILLKVAEVSLSFAIIGFAMWVLGIFRLCEWLRSLSSILFWVVDLSLIIIGVVRLTKDGFFKEWFAINKSWSESIVNWINGKLNK